MKKDWEIKKLGDVCEVIAGQSPEGKFYNQDKKGTPFYQGKKDFGLKYLDKPTVWTTVETKIALENDILMSVRAPVGDINICTSRVCIGRGLAAIRASEAVNNDFLFYFLLSIKSKITGKEGAVFASINRQEIAALQIPVPPLEEQKRIVKILDEKFAQLEAIKTNAQNNLQNVKDLFQSQLTKAFSNTSWEKKRLRDLTDSSLSYGASSPSCEYDEEVRYIRITDINDEGFLNEDFVSPKFYDEKHILEDGDVLFARTGATVGKAYCYHNEDGKCVYAGYLIRLRPNQKIVIPNYIYLYTKSKEYEEFIRTSQAAAAQPNVNAEKYGNFEIPLPPLPEQKRIVKELDTLSEKVRQLQEIYTKQISNCDELKQSLLQKAFEGEL